MCLSQLHASLAATVNNWSNSLPVSPDSSLQSVWCGASTVRGKFYAFSHSLTNIPTCAVLWRAGVLQHKPSQHVPPLVSPLKYMWVIGSPCRVGGEASVQMMGDPSPLQSPNRLCANIKVFMRVSCLADVSTLPALILRVQHAEGKRCLYAFQLVWIHSAWHCVLRSVFSGCQFS